MSDTLREALGVAPLAADAPAVAQLHLTGLAAEASKDSGGWAEIEDISALRTDQELTAAARLPCARITQYELRISANWALPI